MVSNVGNEMKEKFMIENLFTSLQSEISLKF